MAPRNGRTPQSDAQENGLHKTSTERVVLASANRRSRQSSPVAHSYRPELSSDDNQYILVGQRIDDSDQDYLSLDHPSSNTPDSQSSWPHLPLPALPWVIDCHTAPLAAPLPHPLSPITFGASLPKKGNPAPVRVEDDIFHHVLDDDGQMLGEKGCVLWTYLRRLTDGLRTVSDEKVSCSDAFESGRKKKGSLPHHSEDMIMGQIYAESRRYAAKREAATSWKRNIHDPLLKLFFGDRISNRAGLKTSYCRVTDMRNPQGLPSCFKKIRSGTDSMDFVVCLFGTDINDLHSGINRKWQEKPSVHTISRCDKVEASVAIGVETSEGDCTREEGRDRLALWITSRIQSIQKLCVRESASQLLSTITFPLLYAQGPDWYIFFARLDPDDLQRVHIYSGGHIGTTSTKTGIHILRDVLNRLREFVTQDFKDWWYKLHVEVDKQRGNKICEEGERHIYPYLKR
ncbi:hypothetical protein ACHAPU_010892 [Fusarium lateritium]